MNGVVRTVTLTAACTLVACGSAGAGQDTAASGPQQDSCALGPEPWTVRQKDCAASPLVAFCCGCNPTEVRLRERLKSMNFSKIVVAKASECRSVKGGGDEIEECVRSSTSLQPELVKTVTEFILESAQTPDSTWQACYAETQSTGTCSAVQNERQARSQQVEECRVKRTEERKALLAEGNKPMDSDRKRRLYVYGTGGAGLASIGTALFFGWRAKSKNDDAGELCDGRVCGSQAGVELVDSARTNANIANALGVVGLLAVGGAAVIWRVWPDDDDDESTGVERTHLVPTAGENSVGLSLSGGF